MSARPRYCPSLQIPTAQLVVERGLGTCKPEESPGVKWKNNVTQETLTLEEVSPDGDLHFKERPGKLFRRSHFTPVLP